jgi:hypothetical protein
MSALGGATVAWPLAVCAQQTALPVVGFINGGSGSPHYAAAFRKYERDAHCCTA